MREGERGGGGKKREGELDKERLKLFELSQRSAYSFGILLK